MKKKTILIITIISTIISLIIILSSYFGFSRCLELYITNSHKYIKNYSLLPNKNKNRIVISFTTTPQNIQKIKPMINSILDQTIKVDFIALVLPYKYNNQKYTIPNYIKDVANIIPSSKNYEKATKIIPMLLREKDADAIIIALDDNVIYGQDFIYTFIEESKKYPDTVLTDKKGYAILFKPKYFDVDVYDRKKTDFDMNWFISKAKNHKVIDYTENYRIIGF